MDKGNQRQEGGALHETTTGKPEGYCRRHRRTMREGARALIGGQTDDLGRVHQEQKWRADILGSQDIF